MNSVLSPRLVSLISHFWLRVIGNLEGHEYKFWAIIPALGWRGKAGPKARSPALHNQALSKTKQQARIANSRYSEQLFLCQNTGEETLAGLEL